MSYLWKTFKWEYIYNDGLYEVTYRAKVPGGWIVRHSIEYSGGDPTSSCMLFLSDPHHSWTIENE